MSRQRELLGHDSDCGTVLADDAPQRTVERRAVRTLKIREDCHGNGSIRRAVSLPSWDRLPEPGNCQVHFGGVDLAQGRQELGPAGGGTAKPDLFHRDAQGLLLGKDREGLGCFHDRARFRLGDWRDTIPDLRCGEVGDRDPAIPCFAFQQHLIDLFIQNR
jgi:hypothetical protein